VDLPGLVRVTDRDTTKDDIYALRREVKRHMSDPAAILLPVVSASTPLACQEVFEFAEEANPNARQTLGIITKADRIPAGATEAWHRFASNDRARFRHTWHLLRLRADSDGDRPFDLRRYQADERRFMRKHLLNSILHKHFTGIGALLFRLRYLAHDQTLKFLPDVVAGLDGKAVALVAELRALGRRYDELEDAHAGCTEQATALVEEMEALLHVVATGAMYPDTDDDMDNATGGFQEEGKQALERVLAQLEAAMGNLEGRGRA
jgi:hypothetical protein